jgi:SulP family sulfate permease
MGSGLTARWRTRLNWIAFRSLRGYRREWLAVDAAAALTLLVIAVPEQLATARLAGMPPITGYYAFIAGSLVFAALGSNALMSVGADSTIAPLFATGIAAMATLGSPTYVNLVAILAVEVGLIVGLVGALRLGWIAEFLSAPIISGFLGGVAVTIAVHELPELLGLSASGSTFERLHSVSSHLSNVNVWSLTIGVAVLAIVFASERIDRRIPGALIGLVGSIALVAALNLQSRGVAVVGSFPHGLPRVSLAGFSLTAVAGVAPLAGVVALVVISQTAATTRAFAGDGGDNDISRDFVGVGAASIVAGLGGSFPVNASPPRTAAVASAKGRTQLAALGAAALLAILIPAAGALQDLPVATLAAVLLFVAARIFPVHELRAIGRFDAVEAGLAAVTLLTVALIGVEQGIAVAVGLAILDRTRLSAQPQLHVLGRIPGTTSWAPLSSGENATQVPGVLVLLFATPLWYANSDHFQSQFVAAQKRALGPLKVVVLDAIGMSDIDYTGSRVLGEILDMLDAGHVAFAMARTGERVRSSLARSGLLYRIGQERFFPAVDVAVLAMQGRR